MDREPVRENPNAAVDLIVPGMTVRDRAGKQIGMVSSVFRPVGVDEPDSMTSDAYIQVGDRGLFGLGADLYIPATFVQGIREDEVIIDIDNDAIPDMTWTKPDFIPEQD